MDKVIIEKIKSGSSLAFKQLYDEYASYAFNLATSITKDKNTAHDAVQETFIRVYRNISTFDSNKPFKPWFTRILYNECYRCLEKGAKSPEAHENIEVLGVNYEDEDRDLKHDIYKAIQSLQDDLRIPFIMKYIDDLSEKEVADILGINLNTVKTRLFNARKKLQEMIRRDGDE